MNIKIKHMPEYQVAYLRHNGPNDFESIRMVFDQLLFWADKKNLIDDHSIVLGVSRLNTDAPGMDAHIYDACITLPEEFANAGNIGLQTISGGLFVIYQCEVNDNNFRKPWNDLVYKWLIRSGYRPDKRPGYIIYRNDGRTSPDNKWNVDVCLPIKKYNRKGSFPVPHGNCMSMAFCT